MPRPHRNALAFVLSLLLVGMQLEGYLHALSHHAPSAAAQPTWHTPADTPCVECALLAAGSGGIVDAAAALSTASGTYPRPQPAPVAETASPPSFYRSRAPPSLS